MNPFEMIVQLQADLESINRRSGNGLAFKTALCLAIEALKRVRPFF